MKIAFIVSHPTQFEVPFYKYIAKNSDIQFDVIYYDAQKTKEIYDPELNRKIDWGFDLFEDYKYQILPQSNFSTTLRNILIGTKYDIAIINGYSNKPLIKSILISKLYKIPIALRLDTVAFNNQTFFKKMIKKILYKILNKIFIAFFPVGSLSKQFLMECGINERKIGIFSYITDNNYFLETSSFLYQRRNELRKNLNINVTKKVVISVTKFNEREAPWDLIRAFELLDFSKYHLLLIGDGSSRMELEKYANNKLHNNFTFTGYVQYTELPKYYAISDIYVHCSNNEPWGVSVQEALSCNVPVVASDRVGSAYDLIVSKKNGFIYLTGNIEDLHRKILDVDNLDADIFLETTKERLNEWSYSHCIQNIINEISKNLEVVKINE